MYETAFIESVSHKIAFLFTVNSFNVLYETRIHILLITANFTDAVSNLHASTISFISIMSITSNTSFQGRSRASNHRVRLLVLATACCQ